MNKSVSIIIPNFNGRELLKENLPILLSQMESRNPALPHEIIIVDDGSADGSVLFLRENFPQVKVVELKENRGFAYACNAGAKVASLEIVYLLNSDIKVCPGFIEPLLAHFDRDDVFAVSSVESGLGVPLGIPLVKFQYGIFWYWYEEILPTTYYLLPTAYEVFCVSGGHTAYSRDKFLALGGFDTLFRPFYAEDGDICWRAWKRGWRSIIEPESRVIHQCQATIGKFYSSSLIQKIHWKNRILMTWKNLTSKKLLLKHLFFIGPEFLVCPLIAKAEFSAGLLAALKELPSLITARKRDRIKNEVFSDGQLFKRFSRLPASPPFKILFLHEASRISGAENSLLNLVRHLDKDRFKAFFILPQEGPFAEELRRLGVDVELVKFPRVRSLWGVFSALRKIKKIARAKGINLIHSNSIRTHIYAAIVGKSLNIPVVWHQRNLITNEIIDPDRLFSFLADEIICNSYAIARRFLINGKLPAQVSVVYNGVDTDEFSPNFNAGTLRDEFGIGAAETVIGIASRFGPDKGHEAFLKAAQIVLNRGLGCRFLVVGDAVFPQDRWREDYLRKLARDLGLSGKAVFCGGRKDMPQVYAAMDIFVLASDAEPCGRVIFEAMASGKPVVATNSGGTPEIVADAKTGFLVQPGNPEEMAQKIIWLLNNPIQAKAMGEEARKRVEENFKIGTNVKRIEAVYSELLGSLRWKSES
jgi:glycosyltransferase involved in cell wall biosynthesis/GT2 family glycosyltransferase